MNLPSRFQSQRVSALTALVLLSALSAPAASLWTASGNNERSMYADRKACRVGDIITVVVSEDAAQTSSQSKKTNSTSATDAAVTQFLFANSKMGTHNGGLPGINFGGTNTFSGGGEVSNKQSLTARTAVLVADVMPNGNLVIEGARKVTFSGETQHVVLHGIVRPDDISSANTVLSSSIANARLEFLSAGDLSDARKRGWLSKLYEMLRPF
jgi:flagellar L-ring protein precursor FlgH